VTDRVAAGVGVADDLAHCGGGGGRVGRLGVVLEKGF
jgi:hypothetical protein